MRACGANFYFSGLGNTNFQCVSICPDNLRFVEDGECVARCPAALYEVVGSALRCLDRCLLYLGVDASLGIQDQFRCASSCL